MAAGNGLAGAGPRPHTVPRDSDSSIRYVTSNFHCKNGGWNQELALAYSVLVSEHEQLLL